MDPVIEPKVTPAAITVASIEAATEAAPTLPTAALLAPHQEALAAMRKEMADFLSVELKAERITADRAREVAQALKDALQAAMTKEEIESVPLKLSQAGFSELGRSPRVEQTLQEQGKTARAADLAFCDQISAAIKA